MTKSFRREGTSSRKISIRLGTRSSSRSATPVTFPPGRGIVFTNLFDWIVGAHEDDGNPGGRHLRSDRGRSRRRDNEVNPAAQQRPRRFGQLGDVALCEPYADDEVLVLAPPELLKAVAQ